MTRSNDAPLTVACLCAAWCGTCRDYEPVLDALEAEFAGRARIVRVDVEDHDEIVGAIDVENFPTLLIAHGDRILFFGTVTPHRQTASALISRALHDELPPVDATGLEGLPARVREFAQASR